MKGGVKSAKATLEEMKQALEGRLYPGKKVKVICYSLTKTYDYEPRKKKTGTVTALYPYIFTVDFGNYKESFRYEQIFLKSHEVVRI